MPALKDVVTVLYRPRETMRAILDGGRDHWTAQIVILAFLCTSVDPDIRHVSQVLPDLSLTGLLALLALALILIAITWVLILYAFAWVATMVGRWLEGQGTVADVRAALAWGLVPVIWSVVIRIPITLYGSRLEPERLDPQGVGDFIAGGGCSIVAILATLQIVMYVWMGYVASNTVGEALRFSSWKGLGTIAISIASPIVVVVAAVLAVQ